MTSAKISVAMATLNGGRFLNAQLESIARQSLLPQELIVTDDGSSDNTLDILAEFSAEAPFPVHFHPNEKRLGHADNFLKAASLCRGTLIALSDQDDVWMEDKLARCAAALESESVMLAVHAAKVVDEDLKEAGWTFPTISEDAVTLPLCRGPGHGLSGFAMVFRSNIPLLFSNPRPWSAQDMRTPMVHDQWIGFLANVFGKTAYIKEPLALYRRHDKTATRPVQRSLSQKFQGMQGATEESYLSLSALNRHWAEYLATAAFSLESGQRELAMDGARAYRRMEHFLLVRSRIYQSRRSAWSRTRALIRLLALGGYSPQQYGGLGIAPLLKDAAMGVLGVGR